MGAENAPLEGRGEIRVGLTHMMGTLEGRPAPRRRSNGGTGALIYLWIGLAGLWFAAIAAVGLAVISALERRVAEP